PHTLDQRSQTRVTGHCGIGSGGYRRFGCHGWLEKLPAIPRLLTGFEPRKGSRNDLGGATDQSPGTAYFVRRALTLSWAHSLVARASGGGGHCVRGTDLAKSGRPSVGGGFRVGTHHHDRH